MFLSSRTVKEREKVKFSILELKFSILELKNLFQAAASLVP